MITSGFYDTRYYNADQFGDLFEGLITEGIFMDVGNRFGVSSGTGMSVNVDTGKAWIGKKWIINDSIESIAISAAPTINKRIDAVVLETDNSLNSVTGKAGRLKVLVGAVSDRPVKPTPINDDETGVHQMAIAYITITAGDTEIAQSSIENPVGTSETPWVTGILEHVDLSEFLETWRNQFPQTVAQFKRDAEAEFNAWFSELEDELDENQAAHLQAEINQLKRDINEVGRAENMTF